MLKLLLAIIRKDIQVSFRDKKALLISFAVPVAIASFMGMISSSTSGPVDKPMPKVPILVADLDGSEVSHRLITSLTQSSSLSSSVVSEVVARNSVIEGKSGVALIIPHGFGAAATGALISGSAQPEAELLTDPAKKLEGQAARGGLIQATMAAVLGQDTSQGEMKMPFKLKVTEAATAKTGDWSGTAHAFAGMAVQGVLFWSIESGMGLLRERRLGIWKRLKVTPCPGWLMILGRGLSGAVRALLILCVVFAFGGAVFNFRVTGSWLGFLALGVAVSLMAAGFGLFIAALGKSEQQSRGLSILAVLGMSMLGGAWFPLFLMPGWVQTISKAIPVSYAVNGFDGVTWRGSSLGVALTNSTILLLFTVLFTVISLRRMRFEVDA